MVEVNWIVIIILIVCLVSVDKILTYYNIKAVEKNFPEIDKFSIEKNPLAKSFFKSYGLAWGTVLYWFLSIVTFLVALALIKWSLTLIGVPNPLSISLWIMVILYCVVIGNNLFFLFKFSKWVA